MKKWLSLILCLCLMMAPFTSVEARGESFTLMIYLCGTDLESKGGMATSDLTEMVKSGVVKNGDVTIYIQTGGTSRWQTSGIASRQAERWTLSKSGLKKLESLGSVNMGDDATLQDFLEYGFDNFPADRYGLIMWDHGSGATGGLCHDEITRDCLYYPEIYGALEGATRGMRGTPFAFIGFDACLMGSYEMALHLVPFAEYMIASEELEPGTGWNYAGWLPALVDNPGISIETLGKKIVDSFVASVSSYRSEYATLSVIDLSEMDQLVSAVEAMAATLNGKLSSDFSTMSRLRQNMRSFGEISNAASDMVDMTTYAEVFARYDADAAADIKAALKDVVVYSKHTSNLSGVTGLSILLPFSTRYQSSTYMKYYDTENLTPKHTKFVSNFISQIGSGSSSGGGYGLADLFGFGSPSISSQSVQSAEIDWFSQYSSDADSYSQSADSLWGDLYGSGYGQSNSSDFSLDSFLGMLLGGSSSSSYDSSYDSSSSSLWGDLSGYSDSSFATDSGYGSDSWGSGLWGTDFWGTSGSSGSSAGSSSSSSSGSTGTSALDFWGFNTATATPEPVVTAAPSTSINGSIADFWGLSGNTATSSQSSSQVTVQTADGEVTLDNPFAGSDSEYAYTLELTGEQLDLLGKVEANLMMDISDPDFECYVELGYVQDVIVDWNRGKIFGLFDGTWATLDGQMVCMYDQVANDRYVRSLIPVTLNGVETFLLVVFDEENPNGEVMGTTEGWTEDGLPARGVTELKRGDVIVPQYELIYWDEDGNQQTEPFEGDPITVGKDCTIPFGYEAVEGDVDYAYGFCLTDIYGDEVFTDFVTLSY